jgi:Activator of Hsp90 ATPase homolog 1-like protein
MIEPLRVGLDIECTPEHAFETWTSRFATWWPRGHSASGDPAAVVLEPRLGGRIYERTHDGREIDWGEITAWDPPHGFAYLWHIRRDRKDATDVQVRFVLAGTRSTRLEITHTGWERLGADAERWRDANGDGWASVVSHFVTACSIDPNPHEGNQHPSERSTP